MRLFLSTAAVAASCLISVVAPAYVPAAVLEERATLIAPKIMLISMFDPEGGAWYGIPDFDVLELNITVPGLSPIYPDVHCTANGDVCQITIGEAEINAATSVANLVHYHSFDLTKTYFMVAGIAGVNPEVATICGVTFSRFAVQAALSYQISPLELPSNFTTGYIPFGADYPLQYPSVLYGTEVFEFNGNLQHMAAEMARKAELADSAVAKKFRANYAPYAAYAAGAAPPKVYECDVTTSDVWFSGTILSETFANYTTLITNGTATYCATAEEDNGTAEALLRAAVYKWVDFSRVIVMRTFSDFDRPYPGEAATTNLLWSDQGAFEPAIENIYNTGIEVVKGILDGWDSTFEKGVPTSNYIGDIFGTLGGTPNFGPYAYGNSPLKRSVPARLAKKQAKKQRRHA